jgi:hypothetical protein
MVRLGEGFLAGQKFQARDPRAYAAVLCAMQMGVFLMQDQLSQALGADVRTAEGHVRMNRGLVDVFAHPLLTPEQAAQIHAAMDRLQAQPPYSGPQGAAHLKEQDDYDRSDSR